MKLIAMVHGGEVEIRKAFFPLSQSMLEGFHSEGRGFRKSSAPRHSIYLSPFFLSLHLWAHSTQMFLVHGYLHVPVAVSLRLSRTHYQKS